MITRQRLFKVNNYSKNKNLKRDQIILSIRQNINKVLKNSNSNFYQMTVKDELNQIKENYIPKDHSNDYKINLGEIEYKSNYPNIFNDEIKYGILADIRDSSNKRLDKIEDTIEQMYKRIENIKDKLKINDKSFQMIKQKRLYEKIFNENNIENKTFYSMSDTNYSNNTKQEKNDKNNINIISSLKLNPHVYIKEKEYKKGKKLSYDKGNRRIFFVENDNNDIDNNHIKNINSESSFLSTDRKSKGSFIANVNLKK